MIDDAPDDHARGVLEQCARTEEASADYLDALLQELDPDYMQRGR
jgi:DNA-binding phage protein